MARIDDVGIDRLVEIIRTEQGPQDAKDKRIAELEAQVRDLTAVAALARDLIKRLAKTPMLGAVEDMRHTEDALWNLDTALRAVPWREVPDGE